MRHSPESPESSTASVISHKCGCLGKRFTVKISNKRQARIFCLHCVSQYKLTVKHTQTQEYKIIFKLHYQNLQIQIKMIVIVQKSAPGCQETPSSPVAVVPNARRPAWVRDTWSRGRKLDSWPYRRVSASIHPSIHPSVRLSLCLGFIYVQERACASRGRGRTGGRRRSRPYAELWAPHNSQFQGPEIGTWAKVRHLTDKLPRCPVCQHLFW